MKYSVTVNGKPARETNGELVDEATMKVAVIDIQLDFVSRNPHQALLFDWWTNGAVRRLTIWGSGERVPDLTKLNAKWLATVEVTAHE